MTSQNSSSSPAIEGGDDQLEVRKLLKKTANGDRKAFAELHRRFSALVYATAIQVLHNQQDAEDTTQEVFATVWAKANLYCSERGKPSTWITTLTRNRAIDRVRSRERRQRLNHGFSHEPDISKGWKAPSPAYATTVNELASHAKTAVMQLSHEQRQAIQLAFFEGLTQLEIAERTGTPLGTVKARIRRGLGKLRGLMVC